MLSVLAETNRLSRENPLVPPVTFCTGRPHPYTECLMQAVHGYVPSLSEGGLVLFDPRDHSILRHPLFTEERRRSIRDLNRLIDERLVRPGVFSEMSKDTQTTVIVQQPLKPEDFYEEACEIAREFGDEFVVDLTSICLHFSFKELNKGTGVDWLAEKTGIPVSQMAGIGDHHPDIPFLQKVGFSFAPANAHPEVKAVCDFVSSLPHAEAAQEFVSMIIQHNKRPERKAGKTVNS